MKDIGVNENLNMWWLRGLSLLVALMPLSFAISGRLKLLPSALLLLIGLGLLICRAATRRDYGHARSVVIVCGLGVLYPALNILGHRLGWPEFDLPSHILLFLTTAAAFSLPLRMRLVWAGFSLTALFLGAVCIAQHYVFGIDRAYGLNGGDWGAIEFAMFMLVLSSMALLQLLYTRHGQLDRYLHGASALIGMYGALLTQSRGPLLAFVPTLLLLLFIYARRTGHWRRSLLLVGVIICGGAVAGTSLHGKVMERIAAVGPAVSGYDHRTNAGGPIRERLEMWRTASHAFLDRPWAGVGIDQFGNYARQQIFLGRSNPVIQKYNHPHNEYLEAAATGGVSGLLVLLLIFGVPLGYFARHVQHPDEAVAVPACAGLALLVMYVLCALTDNVFYRAMPHSLYFFLVLGLAVLIGSRLSPGGLVRDD